MTETGEEGVAREVREETGMKVAKATGKIGQRRTGYPLCGFGPATAWRVWKSRSIIRQYLGDMKRFDGGRLRFMTFNIEEELKKLLAQPDVYIMTLYRPNHLCGKRPSA